MNKETNTSTSIIQGISERGVINQLSVVINYRNIPGLTLLQMQKKQEIEQRLQELLATYFAPGKITTTKVFNQQEVVINLTKPCKV